MKWEGAYKTDLKKQLGSKVTPKYVKIPEMTLKVNIELDDNLYKKLAHDPDWLQKTHDKAKVKADKAIEDVVKLIKDTDTKAAAKDLTQAKADALIDDLNKKADEVIEKAAKDIGAEIQTFFDKWKEHKEELKKFRLKCTGQCGLQALTIAGAVCMTVGTHGAFGPMGILAIVKSSAAIMQNIASLLIGADEQAKLIQAELKILGKFMNDNLQAATKKDKAFQASKGIALDALSQFMGLQTPSLSNCQSHIETHKIKIIEAEVQTRKYSTQIHLALEKEEAWEKKFDTAKGPPDKVAKIKKALDTAAAALDGLIRSTIKSNETVERAKAHQTKFEKALEGMTTGIPEWSKYVGAAVQLAIDLGTSIHEASGIIETAMGVVQTLEADIGSTAIGL